MIQEVGKRDSQGGALVAETAAERFRERQKRFDDAIRLDTPDRVAQALARPIALTGGIGCVDRLYEALDRATSEDVKRAAGKYFVPQRRTVMVLKGTEG